MSYVTLDLDWTDVTIPNGSKLPAVVTAAVVKPAGSGDGSLVIHWDFTITAGEYEGQIVKMYSSLKPTSRFRLEPVFTALGEEMVSGMDPKSGKVVKKPKTPFVFDPGTGLIASPNFLGRPAVAVIAVEAGRPPYVQDLLPISTLANQGGASDTMVINVPTPAGGVTAVLPTQPAGAPAATPGAIQFQ